MNVFAGFGYDVHRCKKDLPLVLGGVTIPHTHGLEGHSDADVLIHALMDALLGAAGGEDIGHLFPNTDPKYRGISSLLLLRHVCARIKERGFSVNNADITLIAEQPKIAPYIPRMKELLAAELGVPETRLAIKATTNEAIGFIGRGEGMAAMAVVTVQEKCSESAEEVRRK